MRAERSEYYARYLAELKDERGKARIESRVLSLCNGNPGDVKPVGEGVSELRIHYGPGYRVYFKRSGREIYLLLVAGTKSTQAEDIALAKKIARELV